jgi:hypothetical protein
MLTPGDKSRNKPVALPELYIMRVHPLLRHPDRLVVIRAANGSAVLRTLARHTVRRCCNRTLSGSPRSGTWPSHRNRIREAKMTRGRENAACSVTENGKRADSVRMLHLHHSYSSRDPNAPAVKHEAEEDWG